MRCLNSRQIQRKTYRIALYVRSATRALASEPADPTEWQERELRQACESRRLGSVVAVYKDIGSGMSTDRPQLAQLLGVVERDEVELVMVCDLARLSRSMQQLSEITSLLGRKGCRFISLHENLDSIANHREISKPVADPYLCTCAAGPFRRYVAHHMDCRYVKACDKVARDAYYAAEHTSISSLPARTVIFRGRDDV